MKPNKFQQKLALKPLSVEQENAIEVLLAGKPTVRPPKPWA
jgi:hypothetical protein